jgi:magnesium and cobalt transporter
MLPRAQMTILTETQSPEDMLPLIIESGHSRFPVINNNNDKITGILLAKDLLQYNSNKEEFDLINILRPVIFTPESKRLNVLLHEFRKTHQHLAIVVDEYGGIAGMITLENILEQIVGEIADEFDVDEEVNIKQIADNEYIIQGLTTVEDFNNYFKTKLSDKTFETIGGLVMHYFGHVPQRNNIIEIENLNFKVLNATSRKIKLLQLSLAPK